MMLGDFGAHVVKVEPPAGDHGRRLGPPWYGALSPVHIAFNRGKQSICIDLKTPAGKEVAYRLALKSDVLVESFRPGVMDQLGLGYRALSAERPDLVYCAVSGYGQTGPLAQEAGVDGILQAASGLMGLIGDDVSGPCKVQAPIVDVSTGYIGALAVLAALMTRTKTGRGALLDVSLFATAVALRQSAVTSFIGDGQQPVKMGSAAPYSAPNEAFEASDGWIMVAAYIGDRWRRLCEILELPHLADDPRFRTSSDRVVNRAAMRAVLGAAFRRRSCNEWLAQLKAADILCSKVADYADLLANPQLRHLGLLVDLHHPLDGSFRTPGSPVNPRETNEAPYSRRHDRASTRERSSPWQAMLPARQMHCLPRARSRLVESSGHRKIVAGCPSGRLVAVPATQPASCSAPHSRPSPGNSSSRQISRACA